MSILSPSSNSLGVVIDTKANGSGVKDTEQSLRSLNGIVEESSGRAGILSNAFSNFASTVTAIGASFAAYNIIQNIESFGSMAINSAAQLEMTSQSFQILIGNVDTANKLFAQLAIYANNTPFEFADVSKAGKTLLGFGIQAQDIMKVTQNLGDIAAVTGANLGDLATVYGQVVGAGKLQAQDWHQFINMGIPINKMLQDVGVNTKNLGNIFQQGGIDVGTFQKAFELADQKGSFAFNGTTALAKTFNGRMSTLKDTVADFGRQLLGVKIDPQLGYTVKPGGLFDLMSNGVVNVTKRLQDFAPIAAASIGDFIKYMGNAIGSIVDFFTHLLNWKRIADDIKSGLTDVGGAVDRDVMPHLGKFVDWFTSLPPAVQVGLNPLGAFVAHIHNLSKFTRDVINDMHKFWASFTQSTPVIIFGNFVRDVLWPGLKAVGDSIVQNLWPAVKHLMDAFKRLYDAMSPAIIDLFKVVAGIMGGLFLAAIWALVGVLNIYVKTIGFVIDIFSDLIGWISNVIGWFGNLAGTVVNVVKTIIDIFAHIGPGVKDAFGIVVSTFGSLGSTILHAIGDAGKWLYDVGKDIIGGLIRGIESAIGGVGSAIGHVAGSIGDSVKGALHNIHVPGFASGVRNFSGGLAVVGEQGPELVDLPRGSIVHSNGESKRMMGSTNSGQVINATFNNYTNYDMNAALRELGYRAAHA